MHVSGPAGGPGSPEWERARRRAEIFGETLPETTSDERDAETTTPRDDDTWLREQVPPHHGG